MPAIDREACYSALFERLCRVDKVKSWTRREVTSDEAPPAKFPLGVMVVWDQTPEQTPQGPVWRLNAMVGVFTVARKSDSPDVELNEIVRQVEDALSPQAGENPPFYCTTLGGKVHHCWIAGPVEFYQGEASGTGEVRIPIEMLAA
jgi:hypothetical protein